MSSMLFAAVRTIEWNPTVAAVMIGCNILAIVIGKLTIRQQNVGLGLPGSKFFGGMSHGAMLGATSFGHILGAGTILGLSRIGVL